MSNSKDNKTENLNNSEVTNKKTSFPLIVGTGVIIIAGVMSCDANISMQVNNMLNTTISVYSQNTQTQLDVEESSNNKKKVLNKNKSYVKNSSGELFYDSDAEDDEAYYGNWIKDDYDDEEDFIIW